MKTLYLIFGLLLFTGTKLSAQTWQWTKPEPNGNLSPNGEHDVAHDVEVDASGNVYVLGEYKDSLFLNNIYRTTGYGSYLAKYDSTGNLLWYRLIRPTGINTDFSWIQATDLTITAQGVFIIGTYYATGQDVTFFYDCATGQVAPGSRIYTYAIGNYNFTSHHTEAGLFVCKLNDNGDVTWNQLLTGQYCWSDGYKAGLFTPGYNPLITSDQNNNIICEFIYGNYEQKRTNISIGAGNISLPALPEAYGDIITVFKLNNAGNLLWSNYAYDTDGIIGDKFCRSLDTDNDGNIFLYGNSMDSCVFGGNIFRTTEYLKSGNRRSVATFISKISSTGVWQFAKELSNIAFHGFASDVGQPDYLATDNANNVYALVNLGDTYSSIMGDTVPIDKTNSYLVKMDNNGNLIWRKGFGERYDTKSNSIHFANNSLYISGRIRNFVNAGYLWYFSDLYVHPSSPFGGGAYVEYFVAKTDTTGVFQWATSFSGDPSNSFPEGFAVKAFGNNIYTSGYYRGNITTLGNLNGTYTGDFSTHNLFFGKLKDQYIRVGAVSATQVAPGCRINIPFTSFGLSFSAGNRFIAELSNASGDFTSATAMGNVISTGSGVINATIPANLPMGTTGYKIRIRSTDTLATGYNYYAYADTGYMLTMACLKPSNPQVSNITSSSARLSWTPPANCAVGYQLQYKTLAATQWTTLQFAASNRNLTGLIPGTTYQWRVQTGCRQSPPIGSGNINGPNFTTTTAFSAISADGAEAIQSAGSYIQPNPASSNATLVINGYLKKGSISIIDLTGRIIWKQDVININRIIIPAENLAKGTYFVKVINGSETEVLKLLKQ